MTDLSKTLAERGERYGDFSDVARTVQTLKRVMHNSRSWTIMTPYQKEAMEMIASKMGRILNGDPSYPDSWHDIQGFAKLVEDELESLDIGMTHGEMGGPNRRRESLDIKRQLWQDDASK